MIAIEVWSFTHPNNFLSYGFEVSTGAASVLPMALTIVFTVPHEAFTLADSGRSQMSAQHSGCHTWPSASAPFEVSFEQDCSLYLFSLGEEAGC